MVENDYKLVWTKPSELQLLAAFEYIRQKSQSNAQKVIGEIVNAAEKVISNPEYYPVDKYKENNDGSYRSFEMHS